MTDTTSSSMYMKNGEAYIPTSRAKMNLTEVLPGGNFVVRMTPEEQLYLAKVDDFAINHKLYGDITDNTARILTSFNERPFSTGVMLNGEKGSGKTLLARNLSIYAAKAGIPTVLINAPWRGDRFNTLIQSITQPAIVLFDEFEKVYAEDEQQAILTLLDGVFPSKKLFILTCNDKYRVNSHMRNRPGRIYYLLDFQGLEASFIREYCQDNLSEKDHIEKLIQIAGTFSKFNFDMLKALVEEMNRFKEDPIQALRMLNIKAEFSGACMYNIEAWYKKEQLDKALITKKTSANPMSGPIALEIDIPYAKTGKRTQGHRYTAPLDEAENCRVILNLLPQEIKKIEVEGTKFTYSKDEYTVILTRSEETAGFSYADLA